MELRMKGREGKVAGILKDSIPVKGVPDNSAKLLKVARHSNILEGILRQ
jgi:hypothetical protein